MPDQEIKLDIERETSNPDLYRIAPDEKKEKAPQKRHHQNQDAEDKNEIQKTFTGNITHSTLHQRTIERKTLHHIIYGYSDQLGGNDYEYI